MSKSLSTGFYKFTAIKFIVFILIILDILLCGILFMQKKCLCTNFFFSIVEDFIVCAQTFFVYSKATWNLFMIQ
jgi:hypothetical protein